VGRTGETERLFAVARQALCGQGRAVVIEGEPGMGTSAMLAALAAHCRDLGARVCHGEADELDRHVPFAAVGACLGVRLAAREAGVERVAQLLRVAAGRRGEVAGDRSFTITEAIVDLVGNWCAATPVALLLDNLQWADEQSQLVLHRLGTQMKGPLFMVTALRPRPRSAELEALLRGLRGCGAESLVLDPLPDEAVEQLVWRLGGARPGPRLTRLIRGAAGNPRWITEWIATLHRDELIETTAGVAELAGTGDAETVVPPSLAEVITKRIELGSRRAREVLRVAALLGSDLDVPELSAVLATQAIELWEILAEAVARGVLVDAGGRLAFRHDVIRQALAAEIPSAMRAALQLQAGRTLAEVGGPPRRVAELLLAAKVLDGRMIDWIVESGKGLARHDPALAVEVIGLALRTVDGGDPRATALRRHLAWSLLAVGRPDDAAQVAREAVGADPGHTDDAAWRLLLAGCYFQQGAVEPARSEAARALAMSHVGRPEEVRLRLLMAQCHLHLGDLDAAAQAGRAIADDAPETWARAQGLAAMAGVLLVRRRMTEALGVIEHAVAGAAHAYGHWEGSLYLMRALTLIELDRFREAEAALEDGRLGTYQDISALWAMWYHRCRAEVRLLTGRWDEALAEIEAGITIGGLPGPAQTLRGIAAHIDIHRGGVGPIDDGGAGPVAWMAEWAEALRLDRQGAHTDALDLLIETWERRTEAMPSHNLHLIWTDIARLALTADRSERVRGILPDTARLAEQAGPSARGVHALCQGVADADADQVVAAAASLAQAGRPLFEAQVWECAAILLARKADIAQARLALDRAVRRYTRLGASADIERATARLAALGVRGRPRVASPARVGWEALTNTERRIAERVAEGLSNPAIAAELFVSPRTVQHHVSSILAKLKLTSRVELVAVALGREDPD
jgi:DNA-binding NarL/FixJ family response regulator